MNVNFLFHVGLYGTKVYFNIETVQCRNEGNCQNYITDVEQAANFIGAMSSNQARFH